MRSSNPTPCTSSSGPGCSGTRAIGSHRTLASGSPAVCASTGTGEAKYLDRARAGAEAARALFFDAGNPLPKATSTGAHYESITRADTLMMSLLQLHLATSTGKLNPDLRYNDRRPHER